MKKILSLIITLLLLSSISITFVFAGQSGSCGENLKWSLDNNGILTISGEGNMINFKHISGEGGTQTSTAPWAIYYNKVKAVIISDGVTSIGDYAFYGFGGINKGDPSTAFANLKAVDIAGTVTKIGEAAFYGSGLTNVDFKQGLKEIGEIAFAHCYKLESVTFPNSLEKIGCEAFSGSKMKDVHIPAAVKTIETDALGIYCGARESNFTIHGVIGSEAQQYVERTNLDLDYRTGPKMQFVEEVIKANVSVLINGNAVDWTDAVPFINNDGRTMVPLRAVGEALNLDVKWDRTAREAIFSDWQKEIRFAVGDKTARTSTGEKFTMDTVAVIVNNRTYAPIRYLAQFFGNEVNWNQSSKTVIITKGKETNSNPPWKTAYYEFTSQEYHEDEWCYNIEKFGLFDLNADGVPELFTLGGGQMDYCKIFAFDGKEVQYVHWGSGFEIYDNGIVLVSFNSGNGYNLYSYYALNDLKLELKLRYAEWFSIDGDSYTVGEKASDENSPRVPYQQIVNQRATLLGNAQKIRSLYHDNNAVERLAVFGDE